MQHIRDVTDREIKTLQDSLQKLEKVVDDQKHAIDSNMESTASELRAMKADTTQQFHSMADLFRESLTSAIQSHDLAMNAQFSEIKAMISAGPSIKSPPPKKQKNGANANEQESGAEL